jgi:hypothetical protein
LKQQFTKIHTLQIEYKKKKGLHCIPPVDHDRVSTILFFWILFAKNLEI